MDVEGPTDDPTSNRHRGGKKPEPQRKESFEEITDQVLNMKEKSSAMKT